MDTIAKEFLDQSIHRIEENTPRITKCLDGLTEEQVWLRPNDASNSIGNMILHLCGNITQYIMSALDAQPDTRERDEEFAAKGGFHKEELLGKLTDTVNRAVEVISKTSEASLVKMHSVQGFNYTGVGIIIHVTEHYSYHTGQIAFWTKQLVNKDLGFYAGIDLNAKNKN